MYTPCITLAKECMMEAEKWVFDAYSQSEEKWTRVAEWTPGAPDGQGKETIDTLVTTQPEGKLKTLLSADVAESTLDRISADPRVFAVVGMTDEVNIWWEVWWLNGIRIHSIDEAVEVLCQY